MTTYNPISANLIATEVVQSDRQSPFATDLVAGLAKSTFKRRGARGVDGITIEAFAKDSEKRLE